MDRLKRLLVENVAWAVETVDRDPTFFTRLSKDQKPKVLWIGCSDSRVPAETITNADPGDLFVHRNIANLFSLYDDSITSAVEYAVCVLEVKDVIVCGHSGCGGVRASLLPRSPQLPYVSRRIAPLVLLAHRHRRELDDLPEGDPRVDRLAELNVLEQVRALRETPIIRYADPVPRVHGWIFGLRDGHLKVLTSGDPDERIEPVEPSPFHLRAKPVSEPAKY